MSRTLALAVLVLVLVHTGCGADAPAPSPAPPAASPEPAPPVQTKAPPAPAEDPAKPAARGDVPAPPSVQPTEPVPPKPAIAEPPAPPAPPRAEPPAPPSVPVPEPSAPPNAAPPAPAPPPASPPPAPPKEEPRVPMPIEPPAAAPPETRAPSAPSASDTYVGPDVCKKCHFVQSKSWKKTPLARSMAALQPTPPEQTERYAAKQRANLDPARDYSSDATCLECHTTGHGGIGGYSDATPSLGSVSCEACHGPGGRYVAHKTAAVTADKDARFTKDELAGYGLVVPDATVCARCHNDRNPTHADDRFDFETAKTKVHDHPAK